MRYNGYDMKIQQILIVSRPRFWIYLLGPFLIGATAALQHEGTVSVPAILLALYFTFPANLFIYGVNDIFDFETDTLNEKKQGYETVVTTSQHRPLWRLILLSNLPFLFLLPFLSLPVIVALGAFVFLGYSYSAPPVRAKARPFVDSLSNVLYVMPGIAAYFAFGGTTISLWLAVAAMLWSVAMHAYSAVPDITADTQAGLRTIATTLGAPGTLFFCALCYAGAGVIAGLQLGLVGWVGLAVYTALMAASWYALPHLLPLYRRFPLINTVMGALLFLAAVLQ